MADFCKIFKKIKQTHLIKHYESLNKAEQECFNSDCETVNWSLLGNLLNGQSLYENIEGEIEPAEPVRYPEYPSDDKRWLTMTAVGIDALKSNRVSVVLVAGGQGSRLGIEIPKGCIRFTPVLRKSLFQVHAEKIKALCIKYHCEIPLLIMVSRQNADDTRKYFEENNYFSLVPENVHFFTQGMLPAIDSKTGKILLSEKGRLALSPNGHGGLLLALNDSGLLDKLAKEKRDVLYYLQVDNPLVKIGEPYFIGEHLNEKSEYSAKALEKCDALEKIGAFAKNKGRTLVVEYSDLPDELAKKTDTNGNLLFWAGSPAIHIFDVAFLKEILKGELQLSFHKASKKVPYFDTKTRSLMSPAQKNAIKFESFIFDIMPLAKRTHLVETIRSQEFAPIKNATGADSLISATALYLCEMFRWLRQTSIEYNVNTPIEIPAGVASDEFELKAKKDGIVLNENGIVADK